MAAGVWVDVESRGANSGKEKKRGCKYCYGEKSKNIVERAKLKTETNFVTESKKRSLKCRLS